MSTLRNNDTNINNNNDTESAADPENSSFELSFELQYGGKTKVECYREMFEQRHATRSSVANQYKLSRSDQAPTPEPRRQRDNQIDCYAATTPNLNACNDDEDEEEVSYDEEYEDITSDQSEELKNLARQSMVPLDELIAYYQYIQQGDDQPDDCKSSAVSRQSSNSSQVNSTSDRPAYVKKSPITFESAKDRCHNEGIVIKEIGKKLTQAHISPTRDDDVTLSSDNILNEAHEKQLALEEADEVTKAVQSDEQDKDSRIAHKRRIRANVILELINSERDFVKHLRDVVEGYLYPARRHPEIFTSERINTIYANIEQLYEFQQKFLDSLEKCIVWTDLASSNVGRCFLEYEKGFSVYHYYCNNHPNATSELQELFTKPRFVKFFEACRVLQKMIDISLDGFLLTPIQKICKYPLQLNELLKNTDEDHPDYCDVVEALNSMRNCANLANERKRRIEALADVMSFQERVENWFGPKLSDTSSMLIHSGEVSKMASHTWSQNVQLYLFDHLLLFAKKDLLKRNSLILKGRINMNGISNISDADEYKPKKSFKLYCNEQQRWFVFVTRSEKEKDEWIQAFERERSLVESDEVEGFQITKREIGVAKRTLQNRKHSRSARYRHKRPDTAIVDQLELDDANLFMNRTLSLPSCIHPSHVMNFVEDSRVISTHKKASSPGSSSRSPVTSSQIIAEQTSSTDQQPPAAANWFRKMGSRKLTKSQVYNVNGAIGNTSILHDSTGAVSPTSIKPVGGTVITSTANASKVTPIAMATAIIDNATSNYDILEKRYRDHMVSEEQARLFRLNNDLPAPIFGPPSPKQTIKSNMSTSNSTRSPLSNIERDSKLGRPEPPRRSSQPTKRHQDIARKTDALNIEDGGHPGDSLTTPSATYNQDSSSFETVVMLSSGQVVRVREDAV